MAMAAFALNLSLIEHPWLFVAAMVVSEMNDRLSPKKAPPTTMAVMKAVSTPVSAAIPQATGTRATIVPTLVPMAIDIKHEARKIPANTSFPGRKRSAKLTVASMDPISLAVAANAPARTNIHIMSSTFLSPAPDEKIEILPSRFSPLVIASAYAEDTIKAAVIGTL